MHIICCYIDFVQSDCAAAIAKFAPTTEYIEVDKNDPLSYGKTLADHWNTGDDLLVIEHDNEILPETVSSFEACSKPWCSYAYNIFPSPYGRECATGLGCTKFSAEIQERLDFRKRVLEDFCEHCHLSHATWGELDCRISGLLAEDFQLSVHKHGNIRHFHPYSAWIAHGDQISAGWVEIKGAIKRKSGESEE